jgi:hypothetical protein
MQGSLHSGIDHSVAKIALYELSALRDIVNRKIESIQSHLGYLVEPLQPTKDVPTENEEPVILDDDESDIFTAEEEESMSHSSNSEIDNFVVDDDEELIIYDEEYEEKYQRQKNIDDPLPAKRVRKKTVQFDPSYDAKSHKAALKHAEKLGAEDTVLSAKECDDLLGKR